MKKFFDAFAKAVEYICVAILVLMMAVVFLATVGRYSKLFGIAWSDEFARYSMIAIVYLGLMLASRNGGHFVLEVVPMIFPKTVVKGISVVVTLLVDAFAVFLIRYGWLVSSRMLVRGKMSPMLHLPLGIMYLFVPVGVALMALFYTIHTIESLRGADTDKADEKEDT